MAEQFIRSQKLIGEEAINRLLGSTVAVFGVGGVGSFVVEALARGGVGRIILIDDDTICTSNLNRQIHATQDTIGRAKVEVMKERVLSIHPNASVITFQRFVLTDNLKDIFDLKPDYVVDALDTVTAKITIAKMCNQLGISLISSMGTGNKLDPTQFQVEDLAKTSVCPLCKVMRRELKKVGITHLKVVYSQEKPLVPQEFDYETSIDQPVNGNGGMDAADKSVENAKSCAMGHDGKQFVKKAKRSTPGSMSFVPGVAGLIIAGEVIKDLIHQ